jgi:hypothetical protein
MFPAHKPWWIGRSVGRFSAPFGRNRARDCSIHLRISIDGSVATPLHFFDAAKPFPGMHNGKLNRLLRVIWQEGYFDHQK